MTREENLYWLNKEIELWENECQSKHPIKEALYAARKALEQGPYKDTISRQAAIRIASGYCHPANIAAELSKLPSAQPEQRWIPCSDRLPDYDEEVLTSTEGGYVEIQRLEKGDYWEYQYGDWTTDLHEVIAWMPLPEPYEEGSEGEE